MTLHCLVLAIIFAATPALAKHYNPKYNTGCMPSTDPNVPPCGIKDESPVYFPEKSAASMPLAPIPAATAAPTRTERVAARKAARLQQMKEEADKAKDDDAKTQ